MMIVKEYAEFKELEKGESFGDCNTWLKLINKTIDKYIKEYKVEPTILLTNEKTFDVLKQLYCMEQLERCKLYISNYYVLCANSKLQVIITKRTKGDMFFEVY